MVVMLVVLTFLFVILVRALLGYLARRGEASMARLQREKMVLSPAAAIPFAGRALQFPKDVYYHHGHAWAKLEEGNVIRVGLDDFTQRVMGDIQDIEMPAIGSQLNQGEVAWKLGHSKRKLCQLAPLGGTVVELNEKLTRDPSLANSSPYEKGWILKIEPKAFCKEVPELMDAARFQVHFDRLKAELRSSFTNQSLGLVYADGGEVISGAASKLDEKMWKILVTQLFHSTPE